MRKKTAVKTLEHMLEDYCQLLAKQNSNTDKDTILADFNSYSDDIANHWLAFAPEVEQYHPGTMEKLGEHLDQQSDQYSSNLSPEAIIQKLNEGQSLQKILNIPQEILDNLYHAANEIYYRKDYPMAVKAFSLILTLNNMVSTYWIARGLSQQFNKEYKEAIISYTTAKALAPEDFKPHCYSTECWIALEKYPQAIECAEQALSRLSEAPHERQFYEYCQKLKNYSENRR